MSREVLEPTSSLALLQGVSPLLPTLRGAVVPRLCEKRCWSIFREKFCDFLSIFAFSLHAWALFVFPLSRG